MIQLPNAVPRASRWRFAVGIVLTLAVAAGSALAADRTITRSTAKAVATTVELRHRDLPGYAQQADPLTAADRRANAKLDSCYGGVPNSEALAIGQSPNFSGSGITQTMIGSSTEVLPSAALVAKDFAAATSARALACFKTMLTAQLRIGLAKTDKLTTTAAWISSIEPSTDHGFRLRVSAVLTSRSGSTVITVPSYMDLIGIPSGQIEIGLQYFCSRSKPSNSLELRLTNLLLERAKAATS